MTERKRGFGSLDPDRRRQVAAKGGRAVHAKGKATKFTSGKAAAAGRKGGASVSRDREHMAKLGSLGGVKVSRDRAYMSELGRRGGAAPHARRGAASKAS